MIKHSKFIALSMISLALASCGQNAAPKATPSATGHTPTPVVKSLNVPLDSPLPTDLPVVEVPFKVKNVELPVSESDPLVLSARTRELTVAPVQAVPTEDGFALTFRAGDIDPAQLAEGNILIVPPSEAFPDGFVVAVTAGPVAEMLTNSTARPVTEMPTNSFTIQTRNASLDEAIDSGNINLNVPINASDIVAESNLPGVSVANPALSGEPINPSKLAALSTLGNLGQITKTFTNVEICRSGTDRIVLNGAFNADADVFFNYQLKKKWGIPYGVQHVDTGAQFKEQTRLHLSGTCNGQFRKDVTLSRMNIATIRAGIFTIHASADIVLGANGKIDTKVNYEVRHDFTVRQGVEWNNGRGFSAIDQVSQGFSSTVNQLDSDMSAEAYVGAHANLQITGVGSAYARQRLFANAQATVSAPNYNYCLKAGFDGSVGAELRILGIRLGSWNRDLLRRDWTILCGNGTVGTGGTGGTGAATHAGMTWTVLNQQGNVLAVGVDAASNAYQGDTPAQTVLPLLCLLTDGRPVPAGITADFYHGWAEGEVKFTAPLSGTLLESRAAADALCATAFGVGWRMGEFHDGKANGVSGGWRFWANGTTLPATPRFWAAINDQAANPWN